MSSTDYHSLYVVGAGQLGDFLVSKVRHDSACEVKRQFARLDDLFLSIIAQM